MVVPSLNNADIELGNFVRSIETQTSMLEGNNTCQEMVVFLGGNEIKIDDV